MVTVTNTERDVGRQVRGPADALLDQLARQLGGKAGVEAVYGTPIERQGVTVIPVAKVRWGFGGGAGSGKSPAGQDVGEGSGGGGGVVVSPLGYIEIKEGTAEFRLIKDPGALLLRVAPVVLAAGISAMLLLRGLRRIIHG
jgi:uncharacterized spore protein YtfJ